MKNSVEGWSDFTFEVPKADGFLTLPDCIKEHICRFLIKRTDQLEACLIHPQWATSAQAILWERPRFERPTNFKLFMDTIQKNKKCALLVQDLQLIILDKHPTQFRPIVKSTLERHHTPNILQDPNVILNVAYHCQRITSLEIYGWRLKTKQIEILSTYANHLTSLHIVGADPNPNPGMTPPLSLNSLLPRLTTLRLDGNFNLNGAWASGLVHRATRLNCLQLSLKDMEHKTMNIICSSNTAHLTELTLTDAHPLTDIFIGNMLSAFPRLRRLCLEGCKRVTSLSIAYALGTCPELEDVEIRGVKDYVDREQDTEKTDADLEEYLGKCQDTARPIRFLLENMNITDNQMDLLGHSLVHVQVLGLKGCLNLTNQCLEKTVVYHEIKHLRTVQIINCPDIDSGFLSLFAGSFTIPLSIMQLYIANSGDISPKDIYHMCCSSVDHNLQEIRLVGYPKLLQSVIGTFNEDPQGGSILLNRRSIDALFHSNDPELRAPPADRHLTSTQIILLAKKLGMPLEALEALFDQVGKEKSEDIGHVRKVQNHYITSPPTYIRQNSANRLAALKMPANDQRPTTPAIWSNDYKLNNNINTTSSKLPMFPPSIEESSASSSSNIVTSEESGSENMDDVEERDNISDDKTIGDYDEDDFGYVNNEEEEEEEEEEQEYVKSSNITTNTTGPNNASSSSSSSSAVWDNAALEPVSHEINLGGWGVGTNDVWSTTSSFKSNNTTPKLSSFVELQKQQPQQQQQEQYQQTKPQQQQSGGTWNNFKEETYKDKWTQKTLEVNPYARSAKKNNRIKYNRNYLAAIESEGWGNCNNFIPWEDVKEQGYVKEVLEEQKTTPYWCPDDSRWVVASEDASNGGTPTQDRAADSHPSRRQRGARAASNTSDDEDYPALGGGTPSLIQDSPPLSFSVFKENVHNSIKVNQNNNNSNKHGTSPAGNTRKTRSRSDSTVSSDDSVSWNDKDNVVIKVHSNQEKPLAKKAQPEQRDQSKWANATDWKARKEASTTTVKETTTTITKSSWQDNFDPEVIESKAAKNEWSSLTTSNRRTFSRPSRTSTPLRSSAPPILKTSAAPSPTATSSSLLLIDTENLPSPQTKPTAKSDVWDSMNNLNMSAEYSMDHVLVPNEVSNTQSPSAEILDWSLDQETPSHNTSTTTATTTTITDDDDDNNNIPNPVRFVETISGTITDSEKEQNQKEEEKDKLVSFDDDPKNLLLSPFASPIVTDVDAITTNTAETDNIPDDIPDLVSFSGSDTPKSESAQKHEERSPIIPSSSSPAITTRKKSTRPLSIRVLSKKNVYLVLTIPTEEQTFQVVTDFCKENECEDFFDNVYKQAKERWTARHTKSILGRGKKVKKPLKSGSPNI